MSEFYQYCSKCGNELTATEQQAYENSYPDGPVLCRTCVGELITAMNQALQPIVREYAKMAESVLETIADVYGLNDEA